MFPPVPALMVRLCDDAVVPSSVLLNVTFAPPALPPALVVSMIAFVNSVVIPPNDTVPPVVVMFAPIRPRPFTASDCRTRSVLISERLVPAVVSVNAELSRRIESRNRSSVMSPPSD
jgi:hypothetical protein